MNYGLWSSVHGLRTSELRQAVIANNLANADTVGFKHDLALIQERRAARSTVGGHRPDAVAMLDGLSGGNVVRRTVHSVQPGPLELTGNPLDVALGGSGRDFFSVQDGSEVRYTRDGRFTTNTDRELVLAAGNGQYKVLNESGQPIVLPAGEGGEVRIDRSGTVRLGDAPVAQLGIMEFADPARLRKVGGNLFDAQGEAPAPATVEVHPGAVERSTSDPVAGLVQMIEATRAYQLNATMIQMQDQMTSEAVQRVGRIG
jgi:flagellar basal body rod protein FlgG